MTRCGVRFWARAVEGQEIGRDGPKGPTPSFRCFFFRLEAKRFLTISVFTFPLPHISPTFRPTQDDRFLFSPSLENSRGPSLLV